MNKDFLTHEIKEAEDTLLGKLRNGMLDEGVSLHKNSGDYKNIWDGEIKSHAMLAERINSGKKNGLKAFDYRVESREFKILNNDFVMETLTAVPHSVMISGEIFAEPLTAISILWERTSNGWMVGYLHASTSK